MNFEKLQNNQIIVKEFGPINLKLVSNSGDFSIFDWFNTKGQKVELGNEIDYLSLFSEIAALLYKVSDNTIKPFVIVSEMGGKRLFLIEFSEKAQKQYYDAFGYLLSEQKKLKNCPRFNFIGDIRLELSSDPFFDKNTKKLLRSLDGENKDSWQSIIEKKKDFIKTELCIYSLQKLHSWSFQAINNQNRTLESFSCVYGKKPIPRGADLK